MGLNSGIRTVAVIGTRGYPSFYGGFETAVRALAPFLADRRWRVVVYGRRRWVRSTHSIRDIRVESRLTWGVESTSFSTLTYGLSAVLSCVRQRPDVALIMNVANGYWLPILKLARIPTVVNVDGVEWERAKWNRLAKFVFKCGARLCARYADELIFDAQAIADVWRTEFGSTGTMLPYGGEKVAAKLAFDEPFESNAYVLLVARFVPENNVEALLDCVGEIGRRADVVFVGSGPENSYLQEAVLGAAARNPRVHYLGHISDDARLFALWQNAAVYYHGHSVGGTNPALVQAMACGVATVAIDTVFNREVLTDDGAVFVSPDRDAVRDAVLHVLEDAELRAHLIRVGVERVSNIYNWPMVCSGYEALLQKAMTGTAGNQDDS